MNIETSPRYAVVMQCLENARERRNSYFVAVEDLRKLALTLSPEEFQRLERADFEFINQEEIDVDYANEHDLADPNPRMNDILRAIGSMRPARLRALATLLASDEQGTGDD